MNRMFYGVLVSFLAVVTACYDVSASGPVRMAQALSGKCSTPNGICFVDPQPIGSPCRCGEELGTIIY